MNKISEIKDWLKKYNITNYTIDNDLEVSVNGSVDLGKAKLSFIPVKFKHIEGYFNCSENNLSDLLFCPETVTNSLDLSDNELITLKGVSKRIGKTFLFNKNFIDTLSYMPELVGGSIIGNENLIDSLDDFRTKFENIFMTSHRHLLNHNIKGLEKFYQSNNKLIINLKDLNKHYFDSKNSIKVMEKKE